MSHQENIRQKRLDILTEYWLIRQPSTKKEQAAKRKKRNKGRKVCTRVQKSGKAPKTTP